MDILTFTVNGNVSRETSGEVTVLQRAQNGLIALCWGFAHEGKKVAQLIFLKDFYCPKFLWYREIENRQIKD